MSLPVYSSEEFRSKQRESYTRSVCVCLRLILNQVENITRWAHLPYQHLQQHKPPVFELTT